MTSHSLQQVRMALTDLLTGHAYRMHSETRLETALELEAFGYLTAAEREFEIAAHYEWIAWVCERGMMQWGLMPLSMRMRRAVKVWEERRV